MTATVTSPAAFRLPALPRPRLPRRLVPLVLAASVAALVAQAEIARQDWIPEEIVLPADAELVTERAIGSTLRLFSFTTAGEAATILEDWQTALEQGPYTVTTGRDASILEAIEFTGPGIINAKIAASESSAADRTLLEFDATLE